MSLDIAVLVKIDICKDPCDDYPYKTTPSFCTF